MFCKIRKNPRRKVGKIGEEDLKLGMQMLKGNRTIKNERKVSGEKG